MTQDYLKIKRYLEENKNWVFFLDYDGTLADFSRHPDQLEPHDEVVQLLEALLARAKITPTIVSGRRLADLQELIPIPELVMAGSYGLEIQLPGQGIYTPLEFEAVRPPLEALKPIWQGLIAGRGAFYLEDKGWTLAIHARFVENGSAQDVLLEAHKIAQRRLDPAIFQVKSGHKFLEVSPIEANKGQCVQFLLNKLPTDQAAYLYLGDDDKDELAFEAVHALGGVAIRVCSNIIHNPIEDWRLESPNAAREWLWSLADGCLEDCGR